MLRKPIYPCFKTLVCNTNNLHQYDPYTITNNGNCIDSDWWATLPLLAQQLIEKRCDFTLGKIDMPHDIVSDTNKFLSKVYYSFLECFDYNNWYSADIVNGPKNVNIIPIDSDLKTVLIALYQQNELNNDNIVILDNFKQQIDNSIVSSNKYFVRLSGTSGKNEKSIEQFDNSEDIIAHLSSTKLFVNQEYKIDKKTCLIIMKWNEQINQRYEFRIFVVNNKITAVSQQYWQTLFQYSEEELDMIESAILNIKFIDYVPYSTFVGDVYVDCDTGICHLIECNPFGAYSGAGSALFEWEADVDVLNGNNQAEFRYLSIIDY